MSARDVSVPQNAPRPTLILTPRYTADTQALWKAAARMGWSVERLSEWRVPPHLRALRAPVLYAEALFASSLAEPLNLRLSQPAEDWLVRLPERYRRREIALCTLAEARELNSPAFVKPPNDKSFPARVYAPNELPEGYDDTMPVLVSEIVRWHCEYRCFVLNRRLATCSIYSRDGYLHLPSDDAHVDPAMTEERAFLQAFVSSLLDDTNVELPGAAVIDVGIIDGRGWAVVEQNAPWGAGIYGCDPECVLDVIAHSQSKETGA
jgi:hypothetical protein